MLSLFDRLNSRERLRLWCAAAFWAVTYLLFVAWNHLQNQFPVESWQMRRLLTTLFGAVLFFGLTRFADRIADRSLRDRSVLLIGAAALCCLAMVVVRALVDETVVPALGEPTSSFTRHLRFTLIWVGYFAGGVLAFLSFAPRPAPSREDSGPLPSIDDELRAYPDALWVSRGRETVRVPVGSIDWIEAEGDYVRLHASAGGGLMRGTLSGLESTLDPAVFARIHRSAICRRSHVVAMLRKPSGAIAVRLSTGAEVPVGRSYRDTVAAMLGSGREVQDRLSA